MSAGMVLPYDVRERGGDVLGGARLRMFEVEEPGTGRLIASLGPTGAEGERLARLLAAAPSMLPLLDLLDDLGTGMPDGTQAVLRWVEREDIEIARTLLRFVADYVPEPA